MKIYGFQSNKNSYLSIFKMRRKLPNEKISEQENLCNLSTCRTNTPAFELKVRGWLVNYLLVTEGISWPP